MEEHLGFASNKQMMFLQRKKVLGELEPHPFDDVHVQTDLMNHIDQESTFLFQQLITTKGVHYSSSFRLTSGLRGSRTLSKLFAKIIAHRCRYACCLAIISLVVFTDAFFCYLMSKEWLSVLLNWIAISILVVGFPIALLLERWVAPRRLTRFNEYLDALLPVDWFLRYFNAWKNQSRPDRSRDAGSLYRTGDKVTCLHLACTLESPKIVAAILERDADCAFIKDSVGRTPLQALMKQISVERKPWDHSIACRNIITMFQNHGWKRRRIFWLVYARIHSPVIVSDDHAEGTDAVLRAHEIAALRLRYQRRSPTDKGSVLGLRSTDHPDSALFVRTFLLSKELFDLVVHFL
jgi:hypothetical protein